MIVDSYQVSGVDASGPATVCAKDANHDNMGSSPADERSVAGLYNARREGSSPMNVWDIVIPVLTLLVGLVAGFAGGVFYLRNQLVKMQKDPELLAKMARQMGYNMNKQQLQKAQQMLTRQKFLFLIHI